MRWWSRWALGVAIVTMTCGVFSVAPVDVSAQQTTLGGVDLIRFCGHLGYAGAKLIQNNAFGWVCYTSSGATQGINVTQACQWQYNRSDVYADYGNFNQSGSWVCYGGSYGNINVAEVVQSANTSTGPGGKLSLLVRLRNTGDTTWSPTTGYGYIGAGLWSHWGTNLLWTDVQPGQTIDFSENVVMPTSPGTYKFDMTLTHHNGVYGNGAISPTYEITVTVQQPSTNPDPSGRNIRAGVHLGVPFETEIGTAPGHPNDGAENCGPASATMVVEWFRGRGITNVPAATAWFPGSNNGGGTDHRGAAAAAFYAHYNLGMYKEIYTFDDVRWALSNGAPVVILVNNSYYSNPWPYENTKPGWLVSNHIVVVDGYDANNVYINDPLRRSPQDGTNVADWAVPIQNFKNAGNNTGQSVNGGFNAVAIYRIASPSPGSHGAGSTSIDATDDQSPFSGDNTPPDDVVAPAPVATQGSAPQATVEPAPPPRP